MPIKQGLQPFILLLFITVTGNGFHVAGVRRGTVEHLRRHGGATHDLTQVGVLVVGEPGPEFAFRQEQVPQAGCLGFDLQLLNDRYRSPAIFRLLDLFMVLVLIGINVSIHEFV